MHHFARSLVPRSVRHLLPRTPKRVVVVGGGPTGLFCADRLRHHFEVTVVDSKDFFEFTPSILRAIVDPAHLSRITFDYREVLERELGVEFALGEVSGIDAAPAAGNAGPGSLSVACSSGPRQLYFDYCIVAVGVSNGVWKPRAAAERAAAATAGVPASPPASAATASEASDERTLDGRRSTLRSLRERIAVSRGVVVVGAGLVGVELAAELVHFYPRLKVTLVDGAPDVLPQLGEGARDYARSWLQQHNVVLRLGKPFVPEWVRDDNVVLWCVGTRPRSAGLFADTAVHLQPNGQIRVNRHMQVLRRAEEWPFVGAAGDALGAKDAAAAAAARASPEAGSRNSHLEPLGQGRVFAVGDAASVEGVPTAQMIFHGEEMAAVAVANIEVAEDVVSPFTFTKARREIEPQPPFLCCTSLGPHDGMFSTQSELVATGTLAALQKQMIEATKMGALRGELAASLVWYPIH